MNLYRSTDIGASVRQAHADFTHILVDRYYASLYPVFMRTGDLCDMPLYLWAPWIPDHSARERWEAGGGVLISRDRAPGVPCDVLLFAECPFSVPDLEKRAQGAREYAVVPVPNWRTHEETLDLVSPPVEVLQAIHGALHQFLTFDHPALKLLGWNSGFVCMDTELGDQIGQPGTTAQYMIHGFRPRDVYQIQKRLAPEPGPLLEVYETLAPVVRRQAVPVGHRKALKELDRLGYIRLTKYRVFPNRAQDWKRHRKARERKLSALAEVRLLVDSLPIHPQT